MLEVQQATLYKGMTMCSQKTKKHASFYIGRQVELCNGSNAKFGATRAGKIATTKKLLKKVWKLEIL